MNFFICYGFFHLHGNQFTHRVSDLHHTFYTFCSSGRHLYLIHQRVNTVIYLIIYNRITVITNIRICRDTLWYIIQFCIHINCRCHISMNIPDSFCKLDFKISTFYRHTGCFHTIRTGYLFHLTQNHFRMFCKILIDRNSIGITSKIHPLRHLFCHAVTLLEE